MLILLLLFILNIGFHHLPHVISITSILKFVDITLGLETLLRTIILNETTHTHILTSVSREQR